MSSLGQSILMALTVTVNRFASSNVHAIKAYETETRKTKTSAGNIGKTGRREVILSASLLAAAPQLDDSRTKLLEKYLKKSEENKAKNDKERQESYYKRNYKDYFEFIEGSLKGKEEQELSKSEKNILEWLKTNK